MERVASSLGGSQLGEAKRSSGPKGHRGAGAEPLPFWLRERPTLVGLRASVPRESRSGWHRKAERQGVEEQSDESPLHPVAGYQETI